MKSKMLASVASASLVVLLVRTAHAGSWIQNTTMYPDIETSYDDTTTNSEIGAHPQWSVRDNHGEGYCSATSHIWNNTTDGYVANGALTSTTSETKTYLWYVPAGEEDPAAAHGKADGVFGGELDLSSSATGAMAHAKATFELKVIASSDTTFNANATSSAYEHSISNMDASTTAIPSTGDDGSRDETAAFPPIRTLFR